MLASHKTKYLPPSLKDSQPLTRLALIAILVFAIVVSFSYCRRLFLAGSIDATRAL